VDSLLSRARRGPSTRLVRMKSVGDRWNRRARGDGARRSGNPRATSGTGGASSRHVRVVACELEIGSFPDVPELWSERLSRLCAGETASPQIKTPRRDRHTCNSSPIATKMLVAKKREARIRPGEHLLGAGLPDIPNRTRLFSISARRRKLDADRCRDLPTFSGLVPTSSASRSPLADVFSVPGWAIGRTVSTWRSH
jgi:hypothetical protein